MFYQPSLRPERSSTASSNNSSITASSTPNHSSNLARSRRSQFGGGASTTTTPGNESGDKIRILYEYERLVHYSKSPHASALPADWTKICLKAPNVVRDKVNEAGADLLECPYSWQLPRDYCPGVDSNNNNNNNNNATKSPHQQHNVKFQRNLSFDDNSKTSLSSASWTRKSFDAKRSPLVHSKSVCD